MHHTDMPSQVLNLPVLLAVPSRIRWLASLFLATLCLSFAATEKAHAQSEADLRVEVLVANQGTKQRDSAYWHAFNRVLTRHVETRIRIEPEQREELMREPSLYVQTFRYRKFDPASDSSRLGTRAVREGEAPTAVLAVTFPADIAAIVQQQLIPIAVEEEAPVIAPVVALVAVEQMGSQFIISGETGLKFQNRARQLAAANSLQLEFPTIEAADLELINAADILTGDVDRISNFASRFNGGSVLTGALFRLSENSWQSDWRYESSGQATQAFSLTTATLDEALVAAMTQISPEGGYLSSTYSDGLDASYESAGVEFKVENIRSLADYDNVLKMLQQFDAGVVTGAIELDAIVFRASEQSAPRVQESLIASGNFEPLNTDQYNGSLSFRYLAR